MSDDKPGKGLSRRILMLNAPVAGAATVATPALAQSGRSDNDPNDAPGRGRGRSGRTDSDPTDAPGRGRSGRTDSDPNDAPGRGRR